MANLIKRVTVIVLLAFLLLPSSAQTPAPPNADKVRERYTKYEFQIPMRDGVASRAAWWPAAGLSTTLRALAAGAEGTTYASTADTLMQLRIGVAAP